MIVRYSRRNGITAFLLVRVLGSEGEYARGQIDGGVCSAVAPMNKDRVRVERFRIDDRSKERRQVPFIGVGCDEAAKDWADVLPKKILAGSSSFALNADPVGAALRRLILKVFIPAIDQERARRHQNVGRIVELQTRIERVHELIDTVGRCARLQANGRGAGYIERIPIVARGKIEPRNQAEVLAISGVDAAGRGIDVRGVDAARRRLLPAA